MIFLNILLSSIIIYCPWLVIDHPCKGKNSLQQRNTTRVWFIFIPSTCSYIFVTKCCVSIYFLCFVLHWKLCKALTFFKERCTEHVSFLLKNCPKLLRTILPMLSFSSNPSRAAAWYNSCKLWWYLVALFYDLWFGYRKSVFVWIF